VGVDKFFHKGGTRGGGGVESDRVKGRDNKWQERRH